MTLMQRVGYYKNRVQDWLSPHKNQVFSAAIAWPKEGGKPLPLFIFSSVARMRTRDTMSMPLDGLRLPRDPATYHWGFVAIYPASDVAVQDVDGKDKLVLTARV